MAAQLTQWITAAVAIVALLSAVVIALAGAGNKARRDILEKNNADLEQALDIRTRERDEYRAEAEACQQELAALGRVKGAEDSIARVEETLRGLRELLQRTFDLVMSFRQGTRREH